MLFIDLLPKHYSRSFKQSAHLEMRFYCCRFLFYYSIILISSHTLMVAENTHYTYVIKTFI